MRYVLSERTEHRFARYGVEVWGLDRSLPQRELAADYGISRSYVSRIEKRALGKLEEALNREL